MPKEQKQDQQQIGGVLFRFFRVDFNKFILNVVAGTYIFSVKALPCSLWATAPQGLNAAHGGWAELAA